MTEFTFHLIWGQNKIELENSILATAYDTIQNGVLVAKETYKSLNYAEYEQPPYSLQHALTFFQCDEGQNPLSDRNLSWTVAQTRDAARARSGAVEWLRYSDLQPAAPPT